MSPRAPCLSKCFDCFKRSGKPWRLTVGPERYQRDRCCLRWVTPPEHGKCNNCPWTIDSPGQRTAAWGASPDHEWVHARPAVHSARCTSRSSSCRLSRSRTGCSSWTPTWPASVWRTLSLHSDLWTVPCVRQCRRADSVASTHDFCCAHDRKWTALFEGDLRDHHQEESTEKMLEWP